ncbi:MAG: DNA gyrase subunit A, partial [Candidatus Bipolaricaulota bacterium]
SLKEILNSFIDFRRDVVRRRTDHRLAVARKRAHILEGYRAALADIERTIALIRAAADTEAAAKALQRELALSDEQTDAILKMRLSQLTALEGDKIDTEYQEKMEAIAEYEKILGSHDLLDETIVREMREVAERYADERRTLLAESDGEIDVEGLIPDHDLMVTITQRGYVNAPRATDFRSQGRGGKGVIGQRTKEDDYLCCTALANARDHLLVFTDRRRVFRTQGYRLPSLRRDATGKNVRTILAIDQEELVRSILPVSSFDDVEGLHCVMATANGIVNMNRLADYANVHANGINAINADEDDRLIDVASVAGDGEMILATRFGKTIRFAQDEIRLTRRPSRGVIGIRLDDGDEVVGMAAVPSDITLDKKLLMVTEGGYGKRVSIVDFPLQGRAGKGVLGIKLDRDSGLLVSVGIVSEQDEIIIITDQKVIRLLAGEINTYGRYARGVRLMQLDEDDHIFAVVRICG